MLIAIPLSVDYLWVLCNRPTVRWMNKVRECFLARMLNPNVRKYQHCTLNIVLNEHNLTWQSSPRSMFRVCSTREIDRLTMRRAAKKRRKKLLAQGWEQTYTHPKTFDERILYWSAGILKNSDRTNSAALDCRRMQLIEPSWKIVCATVRLFIVAYTYFV